MSASLAEILFPEYRRRVLGLLMLNPDKTYHVREIARLTGTAPGTLARELSKLAKASLLDRTKIGSQVHYSANRSCLIFSEVASILRKTSGLVDVLAQALAPEAEHIHAAFIFGSQASGKAVSRSDIDVMVIAEQLTFGDIVALLNSAQQELGREINPKLYSRAEWKQLAESQNSFYRDIISKPKLFIIGDTHELG